MNEFKEQMKERTKAVAVEILELCDKMPKSISATAISRQLTRSGTAIGANYRASCRAKSRADFVSKMQTVEEECDESIYWIEIIGMRFPGTPTNEIIRDLHEILSIVVKAVKTAKGI